MNLNQNKKPSSTPINFIKLNKEKVSQARSRPRSQSQDILLQKPKLNSEKKATTPNPANEIQLGRVSSEANKPAEQVVEKTEELNFVRRLSEETDKLLAECEEILTPRNSIRKSEGLNIPLPYILKKI